MGKTKPHGRSPNGNGRSWQTSTNDLGLANSVELGDVVASSNGHSRTPDYVAKIPDFRVSAGKICHFADLDLGELIDLPSRREDSVALSIRMDAAFTSLLDSALHLIDEDYEEITSETLEAISRELALGFIGRYGILAFCSLSVLRVLWSAQRLKSPKGPRFLKQVGKKLALFVATQKGWSPQGSVDIAFTLGKPKFLAELEQLSDKLGALESNDSKADQLLRLIRSGKYEMLKLNLAQLQQFLKTNADAASRLSHYGARGLTSDTGESITPDWFFYTWIGWTLNKSPKTVRRLIQTAESRLRSMVAGYEKSHKR